MKQIMLAAEAKSVSWMSESESRRILLVCHTSAASAAVTAARGIWGTDTAIDVLCYGRASGDFPAPDGARMIRIPVRDGMAPLRALHIVASLVKSRYEPVALSQPALAVSRARGILLAFTFVTGRGRAVILDPKAARVVRTMSWGQVIADACRWFGLRVFSRLVVMGGVATLEPVARRIRPRATVVASSGDVVYLRTDIDLRLAPLLAGGSVAHTEGVLRALQGRGHRLAFWSTGEVDGVPSSISQSRLPALLTGNLPVEVAELLSGLIQAAAPPRGFRPTGFIYQRYSLNNLAGVILSRRWGVPLILEANNSEVKWRRDFSKLEYPTLARVCERLVLRAADTVAAVSANAAEDLVAAGAFPGRVRVVPNGVTVARFARAEPILLPDLAGGFVVCFVGLFYPWHGAQYLARAFASFWRTQPQARLLLVGDGEEAPAVMATLRDLGADEATHFAGLVRRADVPRYMASADVLVSPHADVDRFVGSPIKLFEYMAAGKPIVATRVGQIGEVLRHDETALLVEPEEPHAMAGAFRRLYENPDLGARLGSSAQSEAVRLHSWEARLGAVLGCSADGACC